MCCVDAIGPGPSTHLVDVLGARKNDSDWDRAELRLKHRLTLCTTVITWTSIEMIVTDIHLAKRLGRLLSLLDFIGHL